MPGFTGQRSTLCELRPDYVNVDLDGMSRTMSRELREELDAQRRDMLVTSLREAYARSRARLGLAVSTEVPIREEFDGMLRRWITTNGMPYYTHESAALAQAELDARAERAVPDDVIDGVRDSFEAINKLQGTLDAIDAQIGRSVAARPFIAPGVYSREVDRSLLPNAVDYESGQFSFQINTASTEAYATSQPRIVAVGDDFRPLTMEDFEALKKLRRSRLNGKVEPEAVELYTQSVESKRRVKLKPRGGG